MSFADDSVVITDGTETSINDAIATLRKFSRASGLTLNVERSYIVSSKPYYTLTEMAS